jgi:hypothetical protein
MKIKGPADRGTHESGTQPGTGTFFCVHCGSQVALEENDALPPCEGCGSGQYRRDSIFEQMQEHGGQTVEFAVSGAESEPPEWLEQARNGVGSPGRYLAFLDEDDAVRVIEIESEWTRIGRSAVADVRLDHPSVSRRHAMIASEPPRPLRVLDDRSLNGVRVNGESVEWARLGDGDEVEIGHYRLFVLEI